MPGVPFSLACDACRLHKKKCDLQQPSCTRCRKAKTKCVGAGKKRYRFLDGNRWTFESVQQQTIDQGQQAEGSVVMFKDISSSENIALTQALVTALEVKDIRYSMVSTWSHILLEIPRRLGHNQALDAAVATVLDIHQSVSTRTCNVMAERSMERKYCKALAAIRQTIDDPVKAREPETLTAVWMIWRVSGYMVILENFKSLHGKGAVALMNAGGFRQSSDPFLNLLCYGMRNMIAFQTLFDPSLTFTQDEWRRFEQSCHDGHTRGRVLSTLVKVGHLISDARSIPHDDMAEVAAYFKATELQRQAEVLALELQSTIDHLNSGGYDSLTAARKLHWKRNLYTMTLYSIAVLICVRRALHPEDSDLNSDITTLCSQVYSLSEDAKAYRPVGANWIMMGLAVFWCAASGTRHQTEIETILNEWLESCFPCGWFGSPRKDLEVLYRTLSLQERRPRLLEPDQVVPAN